MTARAELVCDDVEPLLSPCVDGELLDDDNAAVRVHVAQCETCRTRLAQLTAMKRALAAAGAAVALPADLEARLRDDVRSATRRSRFTRAGVLAVAVGVAGAGVAALFITFSGASAPPAAAARSAASAASSAVFATALQRHRAELPVDVASPDPRPVQEFLSARLQMRVRVPRLDQLGFGLQGGRVVDVADRPAAHLSYSGGYGQRLSVVAVPDPDGALAAQLSAGVTDGEAGELRVRMVARDGAVYTVVGDVDDARIDRVTGVLSR